MTYRIWIAQDSVLYDLHDPWLKAHNAEYPNHVLKIEHHLGWDATLPCKAAGCTADIYSYFARPSTWRDGLPLPKSQWVVGAWSELPNVRLGVISTAANAMSMPYKIEWLQRYFAEITDILVSHKAHIKHELRGDILIDDGLHNLENWKGIGICFTQPWNTEADVLRVADWQELDQIVRTALALLDTGMQHKHVEKVLKERAT